MDDPAAARPRKSLVVCMTPRCGSALFCDLVAQTGVLGRPEPCFVAPSWSELLAAHRAQDAHGIARAVLHAGTTPNGVFAVEVGIAGGTLGRLLRVVGETTGEEGVDAIWSAWGRPTFVWLTRRDKVRQAISWWRAVETGRWQRRDDAASAPEPDAIDHDAVGHLLRELSHREAAWDRFFTEQGVVPITLVYEDWTRRRDATLRQLLRELDERALVEPIDSRLRREADARTERWRDEIIERAETTWRHRTRDP